MNFYSFVQHIYLCVQHRVCCTTTCTCIHCHGNGSEIKIVYQLQYQCQYDDNVCQKELSGSMIGHTCMQLTENSFAKQVIDTLQLFSGFRQSVSGFIHYHELLILPRK